MSPQGGIARSALIAIFFTALVAGCNNNSGREEAAAPRVDGDTIVFAPEHKQISAIATAQVAPAIGGTVRLSGRLVWDEEHTVRLYPPFAGRVVKILAKPGDVVKAGQPLAQLASPDFGQAQAEARKSAADLAAAEKNLARVRELVANGVAPQKELIAAETDHTRARADATRALERVKLYGGGEDVSSALALRSPIGGTVVERNINPGQELRPDLMAGNAPALFVVTDPTRLWLQLDATERELGVLKPGMAVKVATSAYPGVAFDAHIDTVSDFIDPQTRTIKVRGSVANRDRRLKGEMYVTAEFEPPARSGVSVPTKAVFLNGSRHFVFVEQAPGQFVRVEVKADGEAGGVMLVRDGLSVGQKVVVDGALFLQQILLAKGAA